MFDKFMDNPWSVVLINGVITLFELGMYFYTCNQWNLVSAGFCAGMLVSSLIDLPRRRRDSLFSAEQIQNLDHLLEDIKKINVELFTHHKTKADSDVSF